MDVADSFNMTLQEVKGLWTGFNRGIYKNTQFTLDSRCMANTLPSDIEYLENFFAQGTMDFDGLFKFVTTAGTLFNNNVNFCGTSEVYKYIANYCAANTCDPTTLIQNATGKLFQMIGDINSMMALLQQS